MSQERHGITELDLLAYADGFLDSDPARKALVERHLEEDPEATAYVEEIKAQNEDIRDAFGSLLSEPVPEKFDRLLFAENSKRESSRLLKAASIFFLLGASAAGGWLIGSETSEQDAAMEDFVEQAASSHGIPVQETALPASNGMLGATSPLSWLTDRISLELQAPNLGASGYELVAKKRIGPERDPTVQLVYSGADGSKMNLFLRPRWEEAGGTMKRADVDGRQVLYWLEGPLALALTIDAPESTASALAQSVQGALDRARLNDQAPATTLSPASQPPAGDQALDNNTPQSPSQPAVPVINKEGAASQIN